MSVSLGLPLVLTLTLLTASDAPTEAPPPSPSDAPILRAPQYSTACPMCPAATSLDTGVVSRFSEHVTRAGGYPEAEAISSRERTSRIFGLSGAAIGLAFVGGGLTLVPGRCTTPDRFDADTTACTLSARNVAWIGVGVGSAILGGAAYLRLRPRAGEVLSSINAWNAENPHAIFLIKEEDVFVSDDESRSTSLNVRAVPTPRQRRGRVAGIGTPKVLIPAALAVISAGGAVYAAERADEAAALVDSGSLQSFPELRAALESGQQAQIAGWTLGAVGMAAGLTAVYFGTAEAEIGTVSARASFGPGQVVFAGEFP